jgi:hypothetical protein
VNYRLMCAKCGVPFLLSDGYRFFVKLDVTLRCCRVPQQLEAWETFGRRWQHIRAEITPRQFYRLTGQPDTLDATVVQAASLTLT